MIKENQKVLNLMNLLTDGFLVAFSFVPAYAVRFILFEGEQGHIPL